ncbi:MAG: SDR family NAD(P)-dependent oxidoreductase [Proteobacteria bacterium]|nr:SDR family NAD(P)-dependent oxidoreductase [Pseudomonadota bacterium]MDA1058292.1 SDR family NAD(P)-dependent oxidoreductase [Pseudomonadota bacterium]
MYDLSGKVAVVTGAGRHRGLGEAMAKRLAAEGASVVITDIGAAKGTQFSSEHIGMTAEMAEIVAEIEKAGGTATAHVCDVLDEAQVAAAVKKAVDTYGRLDIMINNAGIGYLMSGILDLEQKDWDAVLNVNLRGVFFGVKHAAQQMIAQGDGGSIINTASQAAKRGFAGAAAYVSSKHGVVGLTRTAALEFGPHNIRVNAICPNHVTTGLGAWQNEHFSAAGGQGEDEYMAAMQARIPLGRVGLTSDIAAMAAFLCSDQAPYVTGQNLDVSGGEEMH